MEAKDSNLETAQEFHNDLNSIGHLLKEAREKKELTVRKLAKQADVSAGMISQIERGIANPSFNTISRLATALDLQIGVFFEQKEQAPVRRLIKKKDRRRLGIPDPNFVFDLLSPDLDHQLEVVWIESSPGSSTEDSPFSHEGEECHLLLQGSLEIHVGDEVHILNAGDSFTLYDCRVPHWYRNPGPERVIAISAMTPPSF